MDKHQIHTIPYSSHVKKWKVRSIYPLVSASEALLCHQKSFHSDPIRLIFAWLYATNLFQNRKKWLTQMMVWILPFSSYAQDVLSFKQVSLDQGASSAWIFDIAEDSSGFIWLGGHHGLDRFDGRTIKSFKHDPGDSSTLSENQILHISVTQNNDLMLSIIGGGISHFNQKTGKIKRFPIKTLQNPEGFAPSVGKIIQTNDNTFIAFENRPARIIHFNYNGELLSRTSVFEHNSELPVYRLENMIVHPSLPHLFFLYSDKGLFQYDAKACVITDQINWLSTIEKFLNQAIHVDALGFLSDDKLLLGLRSGQLVKMNTQTNEIEWIKTSDKKLPIKKIVPDRRGGCFIIAGKSNLYHLPAESDVWTKIPIHTATLQEPNLTSIYEAKDHTLWLGTYNEGAFYHAPSENQFSYISRKEAEHFQFKPNNRFIYSIIDPLRPVAFTTIDHFNQLLRTDLITKQQSLIPLPEFVSKPPLILQYLNDSTLLFHDHQRVYTFHTQTHDVGSLPLKALEDLSAKPNFLIRYIFAESQQYLVLETNSDWLIYFSFDNDPIRLPRSILGQQKNVLTHVSMNDGQLYLLVEGNVIRVNPDTGAYKILDISIPQHIAHDFSFRTLLKKGDNFLIGCAIKGIYRFQNAGDSLQLIDHYHSGNKLSASNIQYGYLRQDSIWWLSSGLGYEVVDLREMHFVNVSRTQNLPFQSIDRLTSFNKEGYLLTNTDEHIIWAKETDLIQTAPKNIRLSSFKVKEKEWVQSSFWPNKMPIKLKANENFFTIGLATPGEYRSIYEARIKLKGFDDEWMSLSPSLETNYTNVPYGTFVLNIQLLNKLNRQIIDTLEIPLIIDTPFWATWWFKSLVGLLVLSIIFTLYYLKVSSIRTEERLKTAFNKKIADMEMQSLRSQMNPHFMFNSLNSIKHFILKNEKEKASEYLSSFASLIRAILNFSKEKFITLREELDTLSTYIELEQLRFPNSFQYNLEIAPDLNIEEIMIQPLLLQPFVENAIWHGLMHKQGDRKLSIQCSQSDSYLHCIIEDNGIGRQKAMSIKSKSAAKKSYGLSITAERMKALDKNNSIKIEDLYYEQEIAIGTRVTLQIPLQIAKTKNL